MASAKERLPRALAPFGFTLLVLTFVVSLWHASLVRDIYGVAEAERAAAAPGSELGQDVRLAEALAQWIAPLRLLGLGSILAAIFVMFAGILDSLRYNAEAAPALVPLLVGSPAGRRGR